MTSSLSTSSALAVLLAHPSIWRGDDCAPEPSALSSGFAALDAALPGRGWPQGALTEMLLAQEGIGEIRLTLPALARMQAQGRDVVWIAPPHRPYAPALIAAGLDLARLYVVQCREPKDALWAFDQALRAPECGAAFAWLPTHDERALRRLQVAAREGHTWGVLWRRPGERGRATAAPLRLALSPHAGQLAVHILKRRGGELPRPVLLNVGNPANVATSVATSVATPTAARPPISSPRLSGGTQ
ncbi:MAG: translesion DNA synthesis-associated protein ImuA [Betaproteobacteria bacterium]